MLDEALEAVADVDALSFYGLDHWTSELSKLLNRADQALTSKNPRAEETELADRKDEITEAQGRLRRAMGSLAEKPSFTKREQVLAKKFLQAQLIKIEAHGGSDERQSRAVERLKGLIAGVESTPVVRDCREVRELEASIKQFETEWKELSAVHEKWEAGRHSFKSNADLQAFKRKYEDCKKGRDSAPEKLQKTLCGRRTAKDSAWKDNDDIAAGWSRKQTAQAPQRVGGARSAMHRPPAPPPKPSAWGSGVVNFASWLRGVREDPDNTDANENGSTAMEADGVGVRPKPPPPPVAVVAKGSPLPAVARPPVPVMPKRPPQLPPGVAPGTNMVDESDNFSAPPRGHTMRTGVVERSTDFNASANSMPRGEAGAPESDPEEEDEDTQPPAVVTVPASRDTAKANWGASKQSSNNEANYTASAKKKGKTKKKKGSSTKDQQDGDSDDDQAPRQEPLPRVSITLPDSMLQGILQQSAWKLPEDDDVADERLNLLIQGLPWVSPLGLVLPLNWKEFLALEIDGGPRRTSKRGTSPFVRRLQKNFQWLLAHYVTILFFANLLHALSHFGLLVWAAVAQTALILAPPETPYLQKPARVLVLQGAHLLLWVVFVRSVWMLHIFVKLIIAMGVVGHAYVVAEANEN